MNTIISKLQELQKFKQYIQEIEEKNSPITISGYQTLERFNLHIAQNKA